MPSELFFSSRRRHTRWNCDWSSDVCSSDLLICASGERNLCCANSPTPKLKLNSKHEARNSKSRCHSRAEGPEPGRRTGGNPVFSRRMTNMKIALLISGGGNTAEAIIRACNDGRLQK